MMIDGEIYSIPIKSVSDKETSDVILNIMFLCLSHYVIVDYDEGNRFFNINTLYNKNF